MARELVVECLRALATDTTGQLNVLGHDGNALGLLFSEERRDKLVRLFWVPTALDHTNNKRTVDSTQVSILKEANQIGFRGFLQSQHRRSLEAQIALEILRNLTDQTLEGQLANQEIRRLLVATNLSKRHSSGAVAVCREEKVLKRCQQRSNVQEGTAHRNEITGKLQVYNEITDRCGFFTPPVAVC